MKQETKEHKINGTYIVGVLTLISTLLALIPAFLSLNTKHAAVFYSLEMSEVEIPNTLDRGKIEELLNSNNIPLSTLELKIINQGNASADLVKVSLNLPSSIMSVWTVPSKEDSPVWVDIPSIEEENFDDSFRLTLKKLDTTKPLSINFGLDRSKGILSSIHSEKNSNQKINFLKAFDNASNIQVFSDGVPAVRVSNAAEVPRWSKWHVFKLPALIFGVGLILAIVWAFLSILYYDPLLRQRFINELVLAIRYHW